MFNFFSSLPNRAKVFVAAFILALVAVGAIQLDLPFGGNTEGVSLTEIQILVQSNSNEPISNVEIQVISQGAPINIYTNSSGYARVEIPERGDVDVILRKDGYETRSETINLALDPNRNRIFRINQSEEANANPTRAKIKYQHYTAQNEFLPLVLSILKPDLNVQLIQQIFSNSMGIDLLPFVYTGGPVNDIVEGFKFETGNEKKIEDYIENYGLEYASRDEGSGLGERGVIYPDDSSSSGYSTNVVRISQEEKEDFNSYIDRILRGEEEDFSTFYFAPILDDIKLDISDAEYSAFVTSEYISQYPDSFGGIEGYIFQYPMLGDLVGTSILDDLPESVLEFNNLEINDFWIRKIVEQNPDSRGFLAFAYPYTVDSLKDPQGCGSLGEWFILRYSPSPYLKFVDIENDTDTAFTIDYVSFKTVDREPYELTPADQRSVLFESVSENDYPTNLVLEPGEHFLIPIEFGFNTESHKSDARSLVNIDSDQEAKLRMSQEVFVAKPISSKDIQSTPLSEMNNSQRRKELMESVNIEDTFINESNSIEEVLQSVPERIAVGPIIDVTSIGIDGKVADISSPGDEPSVYISNLLQGGSCPYLIVYDSMHNNWFDLGTVLYNRSNKNLQNEETYVLGSSSITKVRLEEREKEISYIDSLYFTYVDASDGKEHRVDLDQPGLRFADGYYLELLEGESFEVDLTELIPIDSVKLRLHVNGYYEPTA